ncbi:prolactin releasing hormone 2 [Ictalurus punctatus]|uniref:Prolactin releasing hormone 2 n=1 Tax=Ictalurus punctatus TaxID=7998 RepID=A0A2D0PV00_ICTPU|nr:prolactin releasing hormone 2 [Ictalurus punctatus]
MLSPGAPMSRSTRTQQHQQRSFRLRWFSVLIATLLILSTSTTCAQCTTVEQDLHIVHNVDNRSPEIDPFWYVGRGVRPIGRFGKRESDAPLQHALLLLLLSALRNTESARSDASSPNTDYYPEVHKSYI